jgi:ABC-type multidrug transport system fused ATPase/permease subunit
VWNKWRKYTRTARSLAHYLDGRRGPMLLGLVLSLAFTSMRLLEPWPIKAIIDNVLLGQPWPGFLPGPGAGDGTRMPLLLTLVAGIVVIAFLRGLFYYRRRLLLARLGIEVSAELRVDLYRHIQYLSLNFHDRRRTGDLIVRLTSDIRMLRQAFISLPLELVESVVLMLGMAAILLVMDWQLALLALTLMPLVAVLVRRYQKPMRRAIRKQREREGHLATLASESLGAIRVVQGFRGEKREIKRFGGASRRDVRSGLKASRYEAKLRWAAELSVSLITAVIVLLASRRILQGSLSVGDLIVFISYLRVFTRPLQRVSRLTERMARSSAAGERILRILQIESQVRDVPGAVAAPRFNGEIAWDGVTFSYDGRHPVMHDLDLNVRAGERVAIVGPTGAGKSTLVSLVPRFYDPTEGSVRIDGRDVREFTLESLRRQISIVFQEPVLFASTIAENIAYGRPGASIEQIEKAARRARVDRIISRLPEGYQTRLGERGGTLSGGQRQCIAIARAMIRNAPIVIMDELTVGLDAESARYVMEAVRRLMKDRTVLLITHDPRNLEGMDRVLFLDRGKLVGDKRPAAPGDAARPADGGG